MHKKEIRELICSMLLGDGCLYRGQQKSGNGNPTSDRYFFCMNHGLQQKDYAVWKAELLDNIFREKNLPKRCTYSLTKKTDHKRNKTYIGIYVKLSWTKYFKHLYKRTHRNKRKNVEYLLSQCTKDIHTAIWFMDDGTETKYKSRDKSIWYKPYYKLCTYSFTEGENNLIKQWFENKYQISPRICKDKAYLNQNPRIYLRFLTEDSEKLFHIMKPYISQIDSMRNKFWLSYVYFENKANTVPVKI